jgi:hypothetical protein
VGDLTRLVHRRGARPRVGNTAMSPCLGQCDRKRARARSEQDCHQRDRERRQHERRNIGIHHDGKADSDAPGAQPAEHATSIPMSQTSPGVGQQTGG